MRRVFVAGGEGNASIVEPCRNFRSGSAKRHEGAESRKCLALIAAGSALVNNVLLFLAVLLLFAVLGHPPGLYTLWVPELMLLTLSVGLGIGLMLGVFNVFIRDVGQVVPIALQFGFWLAPI